eukprot:6455892-Amphidinium_carterae.2
MAEHHADSPQHFPARNVIADAPDARHWAIPGRAIRPHNRIGYDAEAEAGREHILANDVELAAMEHFYRAEVVADPPPQARDVAELDFPLANLLIRRLRRALVNSLPWEGCEMTNTSPTDGLGQWSYVPLVKQPELPINIEVFFIGTPPQRRRT